jgi:hypothetical protein
MELHNGPRVAIIRKREYWSTWSNLARSTTSFVITSSLYTDRDVILSVTPSQ